MPLEKGTSKETISRNIEEMQEHGHSHAQAVAAALHTAHPKGGKARDNFNEEKMKEAKKEGAVDGVLNWAAGEHTMTPTVDPSVYGDRTIDPNANAAKGETGIDAGPNLTPTDNGEYGEAMSRFHRK